MTRGGVERVTRGGVERVTRGGVERVTRGTGAHQMVEWIFRHAQCLEFTQESALDALKPATVM